jgi:transcriptional regulator GlxA family with amidase domain
LSLVARHAGHATATQCSRYLLLERRESQARYMALSFLAAADECVARAEAFARARLDGELSMAELAGAAGLAPRTFARRVQKVTGLSPIRFLQRLRIETATNLIETTRLPIEEISRRVGYADPSALRRVMLREGVRPGSLRRAAPTR